MLRRAIAAYADAQDRQGNSEKRPVIDGKCCGLSANYHGHLEGKTSMSRRIFALSAVVAVLFVTAPHARGADYPNRPIRLIVPYSPGGGTDVMARRLADEMGNGLGQRILVENVGGAGGNIGMMQVAKGTPDGYTLVLALTAQFAVNKSLYQNLLYDPLKDYEPIALL